MYEKMLSLLAVTSLVISTTSQLVFNNIDVYYSLPQQKLEDIERAIESKTVAINYKDSLGLWADAGKSPWVWVETYKTISHNSFSIDLYDYISQEVILENTYLEFDISSTEVKSSNAPASSFADGDKILTIKWQDLKENQDNYFSSGWTQDSRKHGDGIRGKAEFKIIKSGSKISWNTEITNFAYNTGNGNINTAGKGSVYFGLDNVKINYVV
ncbi:hypothetical protein [Spiroplasma culicicola]|uniref:Uncharacterized protein n=1 Tax=Spiroplasma culicicola AES-1 TaxID=1276246 RepID=W6A769_9MOLU|nr:hypothetical protein [Spiroplasma culicicola]AHI52821.1 hypothetical protein SCULI_v1c04800 [Spiroplasma culicicola AES-1]